MITEARVASEHPWRRRLIGLALIAAGPFAVTAAWFYGFGLPMAAADRPPGGPIRTLDDIPPHIQEVLKQAPAPTHTQPTPWGLFVINPVIRGE